MTEPQAAMSEADGTALTQRIRDEAERVWVLLVEAYERNAWAMLGYESWDAYVTTEFDSSTSAAHRLLERARVAPVDTTEPSEVELSDSEAQDLVGQVVLSLEALTMGLDLVDLSTLPEDPHAAGVTTDAIAVFTRLRDSLQPGAAGG